MANLKIESNGEHIVLRQGSAVIVLSMNQAQSVAANLVAEFESVANRKNRDEQRRMREYDSEVRSFHATYVGKPSIGGGTDLLREVPIDDAEVGLYEPGDQHPTTQLSVTDRKLLVETTTRRRAEMGISLDGNKR